MNPLHYMRGIVTVLNTPFRTDNTIDFNGLTRNVRYAERAGVCGFLMPAMASEVYALEAGERRALLETVRKTVPTTPLIGGASAATHAESMQLAQECVELGCDGVLVSIGREHEAELADRLRELASLNPGFIMLQDWDAEGDGLEDTRILEAFEAVDAFKCIKIEVPEAGKKYTRLLEASGGRLHVSGGWAVTQMLDGLARGVHAFMPTGLHAAYVRIYRSFAAENEEEAQDLFGRLAPILEFSNQDLDTSILFFKELLRQQGIYETAKVRDPIPAWNTAERDAAQSFVAAAMALEMESLRALDIVLDGV